MKLSWDENKRLTTLAVRGLDMADATQIFGERHVTFLDDRFDYGEIRYLTFGFLGTRLCVVVWTERDETRRVISLRKANEREQEKFKGKLG